METNEHYIEMDFKQQMLFIKSKVRDDTTTTEKTTHDDDSALLDFDDFQSNSNNISGNAIEDRDSTLSGEPITLEEAIALKRLCLGSALEVFATEWRNQYFEFNTTNETLFYGLIQRKGGPCGLLASVQAFLLVQMFHTCSTTTTRAHDDNDENARACLSLAISHILWSVIGRKRTAIVVHEVRACVVTATSSSPHRGFAFDSLTEHCVRNTFHTFHALHSHVHHLLKHNNTSFGCLSFLYSCLLTRGCEHVRRDMDDESHTLIVRHNYCAQEMVNLLLSGMATSNVFDGVLHCQQMALRGISAQTQIGFLSLHEYYKSCEVGHHYKHPKHPVYVVLSESHFSVLFAKHIQSRDLFYYDCLGQQETEIRLTLRDGHCSDDTCVPLERVIRTKWSHVSVDWNGTEPLL